MEGPEEEGQVGEQEWRSVEEKSEGLPLTQDVAYKETKALSGGRERPLTTLPPATPAPPHTPPQKPALSSS